MSVKKKTQIAIVRAPQIGCYVIIDDRGFPRTAGKWPEAVLALRALTLEANSAIEAMKPEIDAGKMMHLRPRGPGI
jgi:hypothetical protein